MLGTYSSTSHLLIYDSRQLLLQCARTSPRLDIPSLHLRLRLGVPFLLQLSGAMMESRILSEQPRLRLGRVLCLTTAHADFEGFEGGGAIAALCDNGVSAIADFSVPRRV